MNERSKELQAQQNHLLSQHNANLAAASNQSQTPSHLQTNSQATLDNQLMHQNLAGHQLLPPGFQSAAMRAQNPLFNRPELNLQNLNHPNAANLLRPTGLYDEQLAQQLMLKHPNMYQR